MLKTLNTLSPLIIEDNRDMTLEQIAEAYRESLNPSLLALAFEKVFKLIIHVSTKYYGLTNEDIASFALEKLDFSLQTYKIGQANFTTYFTTVLMNKFREETEALNTQKRKAIFFSDSYETMVENGYDLVACTVEEDIVYSLEEYNLSVRELEYCNLIIADYSNAEISAKLGVSVMTLSNMRKKLREKLMPLALEF
ncbi:MAG: LuxR C-terminal-related transcriptional regulator [Bacteroidales bacterium]|nr:LuxR C-terminal-related transcriptional regulator [Bacteroidales bacterium]